MIQDQGAGARADAGAPVADAKGGDAEEPYRAAPAREAAATDETKTPTPGVLAAIDVSGVTNKSGWLMVFPDYARRRRFRNLVLWATILLFATAFYGFLISFIYYRATDGDNGDLWGGLLGGWLASMFCLPTLFALCAARCESMMLGPHEHWQQ